ncbi:MAG TPA: diguanylate cyclase [Candidatus Acidoferrales bacterium]|nr:diguanylate cyclase [Candidatus Acidoferrales bacterium]
MTEKPKVGNKILVADDEPVSRRMLEGLLVKWGYDVVTVTDGADAVRILENQNSPQLAVLDWVMPGLEGPQVCQRVREHTDRPYVYILLLTARSQKDDLLRGLESGADDYLTKPFDAQELRARLHVGQRILELQNNLIATREELRFRATHDFLTGISNRGVVLDAIGREHARQLREGGSFAIIMMDLDHFKYVNDKYGHLSGDAVLKEVARRMTGCIRPYDTLGRYGGEEFLVVAPSCDAQGALALAERIRRQIEAAPVVTDQGQVAVTASFGVAASTSDMPLDSSALLRVVDEALYRAKERGRNRSEVAKQPESAAPDSRAVESAPQNSGVR